MADSARCLVACDHVGYTSDFRMEQVKPIVVFSLAKCQSFILENMPMTRCICLVTPWKRRGSPVA